MKMLFDGSFAQFFEEDVSLPTGRVSHKNGRRALAFGIFAGRASVPAFVFQAAVLASDRIE